jgi:hypothetical protein
MAEVALKGMTVGEFLQWEDGTDTRYELINGFDLYEGIPLPEPRPRPGAAA